MTQFGDEAKARLAPIASGDLNKYVDGIAQMFAQVEDFARVDAAGNISWSHIMDADLATTTDVLLWLAQLAGVKVPPGMTLANMRAFIEAASSRRRGTLAYMVEQAQALMTGTKTVVTTERYLGDAYTLRVTTRTSEVPDATKLLAALTAVKPAGILLVYTNVAGFTWDEPVHSWDAVTITWDASTNTLP